MSDVRADVEQRRRLVNGMLGFHLGLALLHRGEPGAAQRMLTPHEAELRAYVTVGALTRAEAAEWQRRFARAESVVELADGDVGTPQTRARANDLLEDLFEQLGPNPEQSDADASRRFHAALTALTHVGVLSAREQDDWYARVRPASKGPLRPPEPPRYRADELHHVLAGPPERRGGLRVTSVELYADCVTLCWHRVLSPAEVDAREKFDEYRDFPNALIEANKRWGADFQLRDDRHTPYECVAGGPVGLHCIGQVEDGSPTPVWGFATFIPQAPEGATRLRATNGADRFVVSLVD
jgi:hypothetical protein